MDGRKRKHVEKDSQEEEDLPRRRSSMPNPSPSFRGGGSNVNGGAGVGFGMSASTKQQGMILIDVLDKVKMLTSLVKDFSVEQLDLRLQVSKLQQQQQAIEKIVTTSPINVPSPTPTQTQPYSASAPVSPGSKVSSPSGHPHFASQPNTPALSADQFPFSFPLSSSEKDNTRYASEKSKEKEKQTEEDVEDLIGNSTFKRRRTSEEARTPFSSQAIMPLRMGSRFTDLSTVFIPFCIDDANKPFTLARPSLHLSSYPSLIKHNKLLRVIANEGFCKLLECPEEELLGAYATDSFLVEEPKQLVNLSVTTRSYGFVGDRTRKVSPVFILEPKFQTKKGTIIQTVTKNQMFYDEQGYLSFLICCIDKAYIVGRAEASSSTIPTTSSSFSSSFAPSSRPTTQHHMYHTSPSPSHSHANATIAQDLNDLPDFMGDLLPSEVAETVAMESDPFNMEGLSPQTFSGDEGASGIGRHGASVHNDEELADFDFTSLLSEGAAASPIQPVPPSPSTGDRLFSP